MCDTLLAVACSLLADPGRRPCAIFLTSHSSATRHQWLNLFSTRHECFTSDVGLTRTRLVSCTLLTSLLLIFTSKRLFKVLNLKRKKITKTRERSGLEPKTICSRIFAISTWAVCVLTIAGGKKSMQTRSHGLPVQALQRSLHRHTTLSSRTFRVEGQVSGERANLPGIRLLFPSASKIPAWLFP